MYWRRAKERIGRIWGNLKGGMEKGTAEKQREWKESKARYIFENEVHIRTVELGTSGEHGGRRRNKEKTKSKISL